MVEFNKEEAKILEENIKKRISKAYKIMDFSIGIKNVGNYMICPKTLKDIFFIIFGSDRIRRDLRRYLKVNGFWREREK